jgi:hypothetical protein
MPALAFIVVLAFVSPFPEGAYAVRWSILAITIPLFLLARSPRGLSLGQLLLACFVGWAWCSLLWSAGPLDGLNAAIHLSIFLGIVLIAPADTSRIFTAAALALWVNSAVVAAQYWGSSDIVSQTMPPGGLFFNKNPSAEVSVLVLVGLLASGKELWRWALGAPLLVPLIVQPFSRGAMLGLAAAGVMALWQRSRWWGFVGLTVALTLFVYLMSLRTFSYHTDALERASLWGIMLVNLDFWGHGLGSFWHYFPYYQYAHNDFLQVAFELGTPGALLFEGFLLYAFFGSSLPNRLVLTAFCVEAAVGFPLAMPVQTLVAGVAAGALCRDRRGLRAVFHAGSDRVRTWAARQFKSGTPGSIQTGCTSIPAQPSFS